MSIIGESVKRNNSLISSLVYNNENEYGIDLRKELSIILHGDGYNNPLGHWVVLRHFTNEPNPLYYDKNTKEGVGGPAYRFIDKLIKTRSSIKRKSIANTPLKAGIDFDNPRTYYFEHDVIVKEGDQIIEIHECSSSSPPQLSSVTFRSRYTVKRVEEHRLNNNGRIEYIIGLTENEEIRY